MRRFLGFGAGLWVAGLLLFGPPGCKSDEAPAVSAPPAPAADVPAAPTGKPAIACDQPERDYGTVLQGDEVKHVFVVKNVGDAVLHINSARGG
jgi:hypothetical protein